MNKMNKLAVAVLAVVGLSGCASTQIAVWPGRMRRRRMRRGEGAAA